MRPDLEGILTLLALLILAVPIVILIVLLTRIRDLSRRVSQLERTLISMRGAEQRAITQQSPVVAPPVQSSPATTAAPTPPDAERLRMPPPAAASKPSRTRAEWEAIIGGKLLNRIGALALILGIAFFLKYAFDNNWITETMRVVIGFIAGSGLLFLGARSHRTQYVIFAQGVIGTGIAVLYLSVYAAFNYYHLVSQLMAFIMMSAVTVISFWQAFRYDSRAVAILGLVGGYLTPFLLSTGQANEVGLFSYIALVEAGLLAVVFVRPTWYFLTPLILFGTYLVFYLWYKELYFEDDLLPTVLFVSIFWMLLYIVDLLTRPRRPKEGELVHRFVNVTNVIFYFLAMYSLINPQHHSLMGLVTALIGLSYIVPTALAIREGSQNKDVAHYLLTVCILIIIATEVQFDGFISVTFWSLEIVALFWLAVRWRMAYLEVVALILVATAIIRLFTTENSFGYSYLASYQVVGNVRFLAFGTLAAATGFSVLLVRNSSLPQRPQIVTALHAIWCTLVFILLTVEVNDVFHKRQIGVDAVSEMAFWDFVNLMTLMCLWGCYSLALVHGSLSRKAIPVAVMGFLTLSTAVGMGIMRGITFMPAEQFTPVFNLRALAFLFVGACAILQIGWLNKRATTYWWARELVASLQVLLVLWLLALLTGEVRDIFQKEISSIKHAVADYARRVNETENLKQLALSGLWMVYSGLLLALGIRRRKRGLRMLAMILFGFSILKIFIYDLSFLETLYRIFSFVGLGLILLTASYFYQKYKSLLMESEDKPATELEPNLPSA